MLTFGEEGLGLRDGMGWEPAGLGSSYRDGVCVVIGDRGGGGSRGLGSSSRSAVGG